MSLNAENSLYTDIQNMYATYLDPDGPEYLHLPEDISIGIRQSKFFKISLVISIKIFRIYFLYFFYNLLHTIQLLKLLKHIMKLFFIQVIYKLFNIVISFCFLIFEYILIY